MDPQVTYDLMITAVKDQRWQKVVDQEKAAAVEEEAERQAEAEAADRARYKRLKAKFGPTPDEVEK